MRRWIKNISLVASLLFLVSCNTPPLSATSTNSLLQLIQATSSPVEITTVRGTVQEVLDSPNLSLSEKRARRAAVKVRSLLSGGHGSGTYMVAHSRRVVVTAAHVVRSESVMAIDGRDGESVVGKVIFVDEWNDIAFLVVPEMKTRTALKYKPYTFYDERLIGAPLTYTGFPSHHDLLTLRGYVAALEYKMIVTNMFGWFGSSGAGVFDRQGRLVGVVSGIDIGNIGIRIPLDAIVWIAPLSQIDQEMLRIRVVTADPMEVRIGFPGAATPRRGSAVP